MTTDSQTSHHKPTDTFRTQQTPDLVQMHTELRSEKKNNSYSELVEDADLSFFDKVKNQVVDFIGKAADKATELIEEEVDIPLSEESVNGLIERYVVQKVKYFDRLEADLTTHNFYLSGDLSVKGIKASVSGEFDVVTFEFNDEVQHMVFRQIGETKIDDVYFTGIKTKLLTKLGLFYIRYILRRDPLAFVLDYFDVATVTGNEYDFEIGQYFGENSRVIKQLKRVQIKHAFIRDHKLYVSSGVSVSGIMDGLFDSKPLINDDDIPQKQSSVLVFNKQNATPE